MTESRLPEFTRTSELSRRRMLRSMAAMGGAAALGPALLSACGGDDDAAGNGNGGGGGGNSLWFENWPAYIDEDTVELFREASGIDFRYTESYNDNNEYFAKVQPDLAAGRSIGPDIIAPTYWMVGRLVQLGWLQTLPLDDIPNSENLVDGLRNPSWDPTGEYSLPWQSGMTGIAYNISVTGRELTSIEELFNPEFRGRVGMLTEMRDTVGLIMLSTGADPATATFDSAQPAFDKIQEAKDNGQIRQFTGNDYMADLSRGDFACCVAWSGDITQLALENPDVRFAIPEEGGMRWSDSMVLPAGAENVDNAAKWMDFVYDPENAARITEFVGFESPVEGVRDVLAAGDDEQKALAESELIFPDAATEARLNVFASLDEDAETEFDARFSEIIGA